MDNNNNRRFVLHTQAEINDKRENYTPVNTKRANIKAGRAFRAFLMERGDGTGRVDFEDFDNHLMDECLSEFWFSARTLKGEKYTVASLINLRHSLSRYMKAPPFNRLIDIVKDAPFRGSQEAFKGAIRELKAEGKGAIKHHPEIVDGDLNKAYTMMKGYNEANPTELQEKVQFDIRLYFFRRGSENMHAMTKTTFAVKTTPKGDRYVCQVEDELNKNHQQNCTESYTAFMPERRDDPKCPVASFVHYISHLHPDCDKLWARPKSSISCTDPVWYCNRAVGCDKLRTFMKEISVKYGLSQIYTNHSIRVTGATILTRDSYASSQIKEVTGHKSVSSLAIYQRVSNKEKMQMGQSLCDKTLGTQPSTRDTPSTSTAPSTRIAPSTSTAPSTTDIVLEVNVTDEELMNMDIESFLENYTHSTASHLSTKSHPSCSSSMIPPVPSLNLPSTGSSTTMPSLTGNPVSRTVSHLSTKSRPSCSSSTIPPVPSLNLPSTGSSTTMPPLTGNPVSRTVRVPLPSTPPGTPPRNMTATLDPIDFDLSPYLRDVQNDPDFEQIMVQTTARGQQSQMVQQIRRRSPNQSQPPVIFTGCSNFTISNLTINVHPHAQRK